MSDPGVSESIVCAELAESLELVEPVVEAQIVGPSPRRALIRSVAPTAQTAVVAVGGFVAGAAIVGLASRRRNRVAKALGKRRRTTGSGGEPLQVIATRTLLLDVHLLGLPGADR
jgi:hypothetical protein